MIDALIKKVVLFDGICGLCNKSIKILYKLDHNKILHFAPLQGNFAKKYINQAQLKSDFKSIIYLDIDENQSPCGKIHFKSDAIGQILIDLGGWTKFLGKIILFFPLFIRDFIYDIIAKYRYKWFGQVDCCILITPRERGRFID